MVRAEQKFGSLGKSVIAEMSFDRTRTRCGPFKWSAVARMGNS